MAGFQMLQSPMVHRLSLTAPRADDCLESPPHRCRIFLAPRPLLGRYLRQISVSEQKISIKTLAGSRHSFRHFFDLLQALMRVDETYERDPIRRSSTGIKRTRLTHNPSWLFQARVFLGRQCFFCRAKSRVLYLKRNDECLYDTSLDPQLTRVNVDLAANLVPVFDDGVCRVDDGPVHVEELRLLEFIPKVYRSMLI